MMTINKQGFLKLTAEEGKRLFNGETIAEVVFCPEASTSEWQEITEAEAEAWAKAKAEAEEKEQMAVNMEG